MEIREARLSDTDQAVQVLRRSISELCFADHKNDPTAVSDWLANKTPEHFQSWIALPEQRLLVAVLDDRVVGVAAAREDGEITLNYVSPDYRGRGVSTGLVKALETHLAAHGVVESRLTSTVTARRFYLMAGYKIDAGQQEGMNDRPLKMRKRLLAP